MIKMIIKGRSPTMRHVSRTHRVALGRLFDRINIDPKIQIKYIDTKHKLVVNISNFSSASCPQTMSKIVQEGAGEERAMAKSKPMMNLVSKIVGKSSMSMSSSASNRLGALKAQSINVGLISPSAGRPVPQDSKKGRSIEFSSVAIRCKSELKRKETCTHKKDSESH